MRVSGWVAVALCVSAVACSKEAPPDPNEARRKELCPWATTWAVCEKKLAADAKAKADTEALYASNTTEAQAEIDADWKAYDGAPKKDKAAFFDTFTTARARASRTNQDETKLLRWNEAHGRVRMAPLITPQTKATGPRYTTLVPHPTNSVCVLWAKMWLTDDETGPSLAQLGYELVSCGSTTWSVAAEMGLCHLYWKTGGDHHAGDVVFLWDSLESYKTQQSIGIRTGTEAEMRYLAFSSAHAKMLTEPVSVTVIERGGPWVQVTGSMSGYVDAGACHLKPLR